MKKRLMNTTKFFSIKNEIDFGIKIDIFGKKI